LSSSSSPSDSTSSDSQINVNSQFTDTPSSRLVTATEGVESVHTTGTPNVVPQTTKSGSVGGSGSGEGSGEAEDSSSKCVHFLLFIVYCLILVLSLLERS